MTIDDDLTTLCRSCGLCCDGALFGRVPLDGDEVASARKNRLHVLDSGKAFEQPCAALSEQGCSIYGTRPRACRKFVCLLHERHRREGGPLEPRLASVRRVRDLVARVQAEGLSDAEYAELQERLADDFARA